jgi:uncharacterized membrane protein
MKRIYSIDFTRGVVMIIMALDHVRDLMHTKSVMQSPTDLATTTPVLFFTRWITYLCAPTFVFLAGTSAYLSLKKKGNVSQARSFLLKRGLWLILLEFTVVNFALFFDLSFHNFIFEVIAAIGFGFILLALLVKVPAKGILITGLVILCCHNLLPLIPFGKNSMIQQILSPLFIPGAFPLNGHTIFIMGYPPIPWLGIMLTGFAAGKLFELPQQRRRSIFLATAIGAILLFVIVRMVNIYGDTVVWATQKNGLFTFLSFMNVTKYPSSLLFCLITLGVMFLILALGEAVNNKLTAVASVYGKVPLFYFIIHFYIIHISLIILLLLQGFDWSQLDFASGSFGRPKAVPCGIALWAVYIAWVAVVALLYRPCVWFGKYKASQKYWWLKYI